MWTHHAGRTQEEAQLRSSRDTPLHSAEEADSRSLGRICSHPGAPRQTRRRHSDVHPSFHRSQAARGSSKPRSGEREIDGVMVFRPPSHSRGDVENNLSHQNVPPGWCVDAGCPTQTATMTTKLRTRDADAKKSGKPTLLDGHGDQ